MAASELPTLYQQQIHQDKYARWLDDEGRRETWEETVDRFVSFIKEHLATNYTPLSETDYSIIRNAILSQDVLPSMRALMTAGPALLKHNVAAYNCAYLEVDRIAAFDEALYILCCGTGVGFSVERQVIARLPEVPEALHPTDTTIVVADSKIGWARAYRELLSLLWSGQIPKTDTTKVRPAGSRLKTFGGRASGPGPLRDLFQYTIQVFQGAVGRKLTSEECHGLMCKIGDIVVMGGVRRSALLSLSNPSDDRMRNAKSGQWFVLNPHYRLANNSAAWVEKPDMERFLDEWVSLIKSKSGERGIFNREAAVNKIRALEKRDPDHDFGVNPCGEILLRDRGFCNLSQITVRADDTEDTLLEKVHVAAIIGTIQSTFTDFRYISPLWKKNAEEERLLGVGMTGVNDNAIMNGSVGSEELKSILENLKEEVIEANAKYADHLGIERSAATTCVKPAGNSTELVGSYGSGLHEAYGKYFIRRNRMNATSPVAQLLRDSGVPCEEDIHDPTTWVFSYPRKTPEEAIVRNDRTAIDRLEHWLIYADHWCEHNPSVTINVKDDEWLEVGAWVYKHFDRMIGVTFMPHSDHVYEQAPYEEIDVDRYEELNAAMPDDINWSLMAQYEAEDSTEGARELACTAGSCEI